MNKQVNLILATKNKGKVKEFKALLQPFNIHILSLLDIESTAIDIEETGTTFIENAKLKAEQTRDQLKTNVLADDSGLVVDALKGRPGIYSARYASPTATDEENIDKLLKDLQNIPFEQRTARFVAVIALARSSGETIYKEGFCEGKIAMEQAGTKGFGYDPIFIPDGYEQTMAQLNESTKNEISHRRHAMDQMINWLEKNKHQLQ